MTTHDDVEIRLRQALEVSPSVEGGRTLDDRVARAIAQPIAARAGALAAPGPSSGLWRSRRHLRSWRAPWLPR